MSQKQDQEQRCRIASLSLSETAHGGPARRGAWTRPQLPARRANATERVGAMGGDGPTHLARARKGRLFRRCLPCGTRSALPNVFLWSRTRPRPRATKSRRLAGTRARGTRAGPWQRASDPDCQDGFSGRALRGAFAGEQPRGAAVGLVPRWWTCLSPAGSARLLTAGRAGRGNWSLGLGGGVMVLLEAADVAGSGSLAGVPCWTMTTRRQNNNT
jgi:hypothetical protein